MLQVKTFVSQWTLLPEFYNTETKVYELTKSNGGIKTTDEMIDMYASWVEISYYLN